MYAKTEKHRGSLIRKIGSKPKSKIKTVFQFLPQHKIIFINDFEPIYSQEVAVSPPGYIQSLMSKIVNNISIVCNNVILKYLEEDIVLSLNARTVSLTSANSKWETAFTGNGLIHPDISGHFH